MTELEARLASLETKADFYDSALAEIKAKLDRFDTRFNLVILLLTLTAFLSGSSAIKWVLDFILKK
jgi:hypothetical protein